jgi:hypothetical protein
MNQLQNIKTQLYRHAQQIITEKIERNQQSLRNLKESAGSETKSTAGDKHETGRAMIHLEQEKMTQQLTANTQIKNVLDKIDPEQVQEVVGLGALLVTNKLRLFISVALGQVKLGGADYFLLSIQSPIAKAFIGKKAGEKVEFNGVEHLIKEII